jgi:hypothetical protein
MRVQTNWKLVRRNRRFANYLFFFSMAVLLGGFVIANLQLATTPDDPSFALSLILPWLVIPVGFISTLISVRMTNLWIRRPRPETAIPEGLKGINKRSVLYNYHHFPARHVLLTPHGVYAMITRWQEGAYINDGSEWKTIGGRFRFLTRVFRRDDILNPTEESQRAAAHVRQLIAPVAPDVEVQPLIIFVDPRARVETINPAVPVLYADERQKPNLRDYMREQAQTVSSAQNAAKKEKGGKGKPTVSVSAPVSVEVIAEHLDQGLAG